VQQIKPLPPLLVAVSQSHALQKDNEQKHRETPEVHTGRWALKKTLGTLKDDF